jgi:hypothetical protein
VFYEAGCRDIVLAYPTVGDDKWGRLAAMATGGRITVNVDSEREARGLSAAATGAGATVYVQIEIDTCGHRCGFAPSRVEEIEAFAKLIGSLPGLELDGITTHRGKSVGRLASLTNEEAGREEGQLLVDLAQRLRARGIRRDLRARHRRQHAQPGLGDGRRRLEDVHERARGGSRGGRRNRRGRDAGHRGARNGRARRGGVGRARPEAFASLPSTRAPRSISPTSSSGVREGVVEKVWPVLARGKRT